jgi:hypothetical protein
VKVVKMGMWNVDRRLRVGGTSGDGLEIIWSESETVNKWDWGGLHHCHQHHKARMRQGPGEERRAPIECGDAK